MSIAAAAASWGQELRRLLLLGSGPVHRQEGAQTVGHRGAQSLQRAKLVRAGVRMHERRTLATFTAFSEENRLSTVRAHPSRASRWVHERRPNAAFSATERGARRRFVVLGRTPFLDRVFAAHHRRRADQNNSRGC